MRSNGNDSLVSLEGSYKLFGKVSWIRFENVDWNGDKIFGVGENSDGKYSVTGSYVRGARASFVVSYAGRAGMRFQGGVTEGGMLEPCPPDPEYCDCDAVIVFMLLCQC